MYYVHTAVTLSFEELQTCFIFIDVRVGLDMGMLVQQSRLKAGLSQKDLAGVSFSCWMRTTSAQERVKGTVMMAFGCTDVCAYHLLICSGWIAGQLVI